MPTIKSQDGVQIYYRVDGEASGGPTLILSCATFGTVEHWNSIRDRLAEHCRLVTWDYRGHGRSDAPEDPRRYSLELLLEDLAAIQEQVAPGEATFVGGLSFGGLLSLCYGLEHPERVRALVLLNTGPGFKNPEAAAGWADMLNRATAKLERVGMDEYLNGKRAAFELLGKDPTTPAALAARKDIANAAIPGLICFGRHIAGPVPSLVDHLAEIDIPALILVGEEDENFQRASLVLEAKLPQGRRIEIPNAGHAVQLDQPEALSQAILEFLGASATPAK